MADTDDPFLPSDLTARPRPGAGRRGVPDSGIYQRPPCRVSPRSNHPGVGARFLGLGLNPLVQAASPLLLLDRPDAERAGNNGCPQPSAARARGDSALRRAARASATQRNRPRRAVALCAGLDEAVLSTPWGAQSEWAQHPLLVALHREAWGGEKFFEMLDRISSIRRVTSISWSCSI